MTVDYDSSTAALQQAMEAFSHSGIRRDRYWNAESRFYVDHPACLDARLSWERAPRFLSVSRLSPGDKVVTRAHS